MDECVFNIVDIPLCYYVIPVLFELLGLCRYNQVSPCLFADYFIARIAYHVNFGIIYICYYLIRAEDMKSYRCISEEVSESILAFLQSLLR